MGSGRWRPACHQVSPRPTNRRVLPPRIRRQHWRSLMSELVSSDIEQLAAEAASHFWFHSIDLGNGLITQGSKSPEILQIEYERVFMKIDLRGKTVLDIGAWNGAFSLEAHRRGAASVTALDHFTWYHPAFMGRA